MKNKTTAAILALLCGSLGVHRFYMGHTVPGIVYLVLCWTGIPSILAIVEGVMYLMDTEEKFQERVEAAKFISIM